MITLANLKSSKILGKYEWPLMQKVVKYFADRGFQVIPHTRLNIACSNVLSDVDVLAVKNGRIFVVEVKSHKDNMRRAIEQLNRLRDFTDYIFVATDKHIKQWQYKDIGLLVLDKDSDTIKELNRPRLLRTNPRLRTVQSFQKKCLLRTSSVICKESPDRRVYKFKVAQMVVRDSSPNYLRSYLKQIATCGLDCKGNCPIWEFKKNGYRALVAPSVKTLVAKEQPL